jgi:EAL domain-containing protein (putative c-di-GMP-specific phosphodiesterase class I)
MKIKDIFIHYENIQVWDENDNYYFIKPKELIPLLEKAEIIIEKKKTRTWLHFK